MSSNSFKVKNSLVLTPKDLSTLVSPEAGDLACDINDSNKIKRYDSALAAWIEVGSGSVGGVDIMFVQDFESASLSSFTQTGLSLSQSSPLHGKVSALLTHQAAVNQSFKQVVAVDPKFRGQLMNLQLNIKSSASAGNVTISVYDETNSASILSSTQLDLSSDVSGRSDSVSFSIPSSCASLSYTIIALPQAGSPVTRIDDIICQISNPALLETSVSVPNLTAWQGYTPTFQGFGTPTNVEFEWRQVGENVEIRGKLTAGTSTAVEARVGLPAGLTSAGTSLIPSLQMVGSLARSSSGTAVTFHVLQEPSVSYMTFSQVVASGSAGLTKLNGDGLLANGITASFFASVPCSGLSALSTKTIPLTQSGLVQEADSVLYAAGNAGQTITSVVTDIPFTFISNTGSDISFSGSTFSVNTDGVYSISGAIRQTVSGFQAIYLFDNGVGTKNVGYDASSQIFPFALTTDLKAGRTYSIRAGTTATLFNSSEHSLTVTHQGSLKQVSVSSDQKITIPTSELRFEGASAKGSTATAIVKFDTMAKIRGDAFTVENDAVLGTRITMKKAGKLDISASIYSGTIAGWYLYITKNQAVLTSSNPSLSEILSSSGANATTNKAATASCSVFVNVGDVLRVSTSTSITADPINNFNLTFQEQDIAVSVTNTLPQFSDSDSCVRLSGAGASPFGSSATTTRRFASVVQNLGTDIEYIDSSTLGGQFIAKVNGIYNISYSEISTANASVCAIYVEVNGVQVSYDVARLNSSSTISKGMGTSWQGFLSAGDIVTATNSGAANNDGNSVAFTISKVGKPNVTGVDVTPFVNVPQPESQSSYLNSSTSFTNTIITGALTSSIGSGIFSYNSSTGLYTILKTAIISAHVSMNTTAAAYTQAEIRVNNVTVAQSLSNNNSGYFSTTSYSGILSAGQTIAFLNNSATASSVQKISLSATANSDQILTAPESFSTDTASLSYASSAAYTLSTLQNAPVGTFITFTYAANTNTRTQTTTAPSQSTADMNANGIQIFTRAYNAASTAGNPAAIAIQIGKGLKGKSLDLYKSAGKVTAGSLDYVVFGTDSASRGVRFREYEETTGILILDAGLQENTHKIQATS